MSDILTEINLPGTRYKGGFADWGRKTPAEMIAMVRRMAQNDLDSAQACLAALDGDFRVTIVRGSLTRRHIKTLQEGKEARDGNA